MDRFTVSQQGLDALYKSPGQSIEAKVGSHSCKISVAIPYYKAIVAEHYASQLPQSLQALCDQSGVPFGFDHFGIVCEFDTPTELDMHNAELIMDDTAKSMLNRFGPVIIHNAYLSKELRDIGHRNRFPHLNFHVDRSPNQPTPYSFFTRNPFDDIQKAPRTSSTLFVANIVGYLQSLKEGQPPKSQDEPLAGHYDIFSSESMAELLGSLILEHSWDKPEGTGEISIQDNRTVLHASYYPNPNEKGYRIGVRYLK